MGMARALDIEQPAGGSAGRRTMLAVLLLTGALLAILVLPARLTIAGRPQPTPRTDASVERIGRSLAQADLIHLDDSPTGYICHADSCMSGIDAGNYKTACIVGDAAGCRLVLQIIELECDAGFAGSCDALAKLNP